MMEGVNGRVGGQAIESLPGQAVSRQRPAKPSDFRSGARLRGSSTGEERDYPSTGHPSTAWAVLQASVQPARSRTRQVKEFEMSQ